MKIRYLLMIMLVMISILDGVSLALSRQKMLQRQPPLVQPQAEKPSANGQAIALTNWVRLSRKFYKLRQNHR